MQRKLTVHTSSLLLIDTRFFATNEIRLDTINSPDINDLSIDEGKEFQSMQARTLNLSSSSLLLDNTLTRRKQQLASSVLMLLFFCASIARRG